MPKNLIIYFFWLKFVLYLAGTVNQFFLHFSGTGNQLVLYFGGSDNWLLVPPKNRTNWFPVPPKCRKDWLTVPAKYSTNLSHKNIPFSDYFWFWNFLARCIFILTLMTQTHGLSIKNCVTPSKNEELFQIGLMNCTHVAGVWLVDCPRLGP